MAQRFVVKQLDNTPPVDCPCGRAFRIITGEDNEHLSIHVVDISKDSKPHYHKRQTEYYLVLEGEGTLEIDGEAVPLRRGTAVMIPPGAVHRAVGKLRIVNVVVPPFSPEDEFLAEES